MEIVGRSVRQFRRSRHCVTEAMAALGCDEKCIRCIATNADYCLQANERCKISGDMPPLVQ